MGKKENISASKNKLKEGKKIKQNKHSGKKNKSTTIPSKTQKVKAIQKEMTKLNKVKGGKNLFEIIPMDDDQQEEVQDINGQQDYENEENIDQNYEQLQNQEIEQQQDEQQGEQYNGQQENENENDGQLGEEQLGDDNVGEQQNNDEIDGELKEEVQQKQQNVDISVIKLQIQQTISILMNVNRLGQGLPRKHYIEKLKQYIHQYYGYNFELINHFMDLFNPTQLIQFLQANQTQRPLTIRTNTLKTRRKQLAQALIQRGVSLDPLAEWSKVGIKIYQTKVPIGATPEYLAGHYMLQSASSFLPVIALDPQMGDRVLDMASAPGGKTTYIAQIMKNTGCIFANDLKKQRLRALQFNIYRMGITNTVVTCRDGRKYPSIYPNTFDRVLLDAPCTGLGIISKDQSIKANRVLIDIYKNSHVQKQLLVAAIDCAKVNGVIVYSTCSVSPLENQEVVNFALKKRFVKIVECGIEVGEEGLVKFGQKRFHVDLRKTRRIYPHVHNMDGFYVAKLIKLGKGKKNQSKNQQNQPVEQQHKSIE